MGNTITLKLPKPPHRFELTFEADGESLAIDALVDWVNNRELDFDWMDAAVLSHQIGQVLARELLKHYLP
jgi:hypothetical protein